MPFSNITRFQVWELPVFIGGSPLLMTTVRLAWLFLRLGAVLAAALGVWRFGVDPGWTNEFVIAEGIFSRYQTWFALAFFAQTSAVVLGHWSAIPVSVGEEELK